MYPTSTGAGAMRTWKRTSAIADITDPELLAIPTYEATPPEGVRCFSEYFRLAGYYCTNNEKTDYQFRPPLTAWDESSKTAHWRNRPDPNMPFFAIFNNTVPHESGTFAPRSPRVVDPSQIVIPPYYPETPTVREDLARHYDNIYAMDQWGGRATEPIRGGWSPGTKPSSSFSATTETAYLVPKGGYMTPAYTCPLLCDGLIKKKPEP